LEDSVIQDLTTLLKFLLMNTLNHDRKPEWTPGRSVAWRIYDSWQHSCG
jgi:hypothetical protein